MDLGTRVRFPPPPLFTSTDASLKSVTPSDETLAPAGAFCRRKSYRGRRHVRREKPPDARLTPKPYNRKGVYNNIFIASPIAQPTDAMRTRVFLIYMEIVIVWNLDAQAYLVGFGRRSGVMIINTFIEDCVGEVAFLMRKAMRLVTLPTLF